MNRSRTRAFNQFMNGLLGSPTMMSDRQRLMCARMMDRWITQTHFGPRKLPHDLTSRRAGRPLPPDELYFRHGWIKAHWQSARTVFMLDKNNKIGRWTLDPQCYVQWPMRDSHIDNPSSWDTIIATEHRWLQITISPAYHRSDAPKYRRVGDKVITRLWEKRTHDNNKTFYRCMYWDFSKLGRSVTSYGQCKFVDGYLVDHMGVVALEASLHKAGQIAAKQVALKVIENIKSDFSEDDTT